MLSSLAALFGAVLAASPPRAPAIELRWHAPPTCPSEAVLRAAIEAHVGRSLSDIRDRPLSVIATVYPAESHWSLSIYTVTAEGTQERTLRYAHGCAPLADAAAVLIAMTIDPQVLGRIDPALLEIIAQDPAAEPSPPAVASPPEADPESDTPSPSPSPEPPPLNKARPPSADPRAIPWIPRAALRLSGSLGWGDLPSLGGGAQLALALRWGRVQFEVAGGGWFLRSVKLSLPNASGAVFNLGNAALRAGYVVAAGRRLEIPLFLGLEAGAIHVRGVRLVETSAARTAWCAALLSPGITVVLREFLALAFSLDVFVPLTRARFVVANVGEIFRPEAIGLRLGVGIEFRFPTRSSSAR